MLKPSRVMAFMLKTYLNYLQVKDTLSQRRWQMISYQNFRVFLKVYNFYLNSKQVNMQF